MNKQDQSNKRNFAPIIAIVLGVALIIAARTVQSKTGTVKLPGDVALSAIEHLQMISEADHSRGDANAPMRLIEYSDLQCPFCKIFHKSMLEISPEYIATGKLQWAYRHFPLVSSHENAKNLAIATECAAKQGGDDAFWKMVDGIFADPDQKFDMTKLPTIAKASGVNVSLYMNCFASKQTAAAVDEDMADGTKIGVGGTPYAVLISPTGKTFPLARAYSASELRTIFDAVMKQ